MTVLLRQDTHLISVQAANHQRVVGRDDQLADDSSEEHLKALVENLPGSTESDELPEAALDEMAAELFRGYDAKEADGADAEPG